MPSAWTMEASAFNRSGETNRPRRGQGSMRMKRTVMFALAVIVMLLAVVPGAIAGSVDLYVDSAPNAYGSLAYPAWRDSAYQNAADGSFVNMANGTFPNSTVFDPVDAIVYSTGDGGKRLSWAYFVEGATVASLTGKFEVRTVADWDGVAYTYDWGSGTTVEATADNGWSQPLSWIDFTYAGHTGVVGIFGNAWWAWDNDALPYSTDSNYYNETDAADIQALRQAMFQSQTYWSGQVRMMGDSGTWTVTELTATVVPLPAAGWAGLVLLGSLGGIKGLKKRFGRKEL
jgi:hypothetical protein